MGSGTAKYGFEWPTPPENLKIEALRNVISSAAVLRGNLGALGNS